MDHKRYRRYFIILDNEDDGFQNKQGKNPKGYTKIETKNGKGVLNHYVQNLKYFDNAAYIYRGYLIGTKDGKRIYANSGTLVIDESGKGELSWKFDPENVDGQGNPIKDFNVVAIVAETADAPNRSREIVAPLVGFIDKQKVAWKNILAEGYIRKEKQKEAVKEAEKSLEEVVYEPEKKESPIQMKEKEVVEDKIQMEEEISLEEEEKELPKKETKINEPIKPLEGKEEAIEKINEVNEETKNNESTDDIKDKVIKEKEEVKPKGPFQIKGNQWGYEQQQPLKVHEKYKEENTKTHGEAIEETIKEKPMKEEPMKEKPVQQPVKEEPIKETPMKQQPVKEESTEDKSMQEKPVQEKPVQEKSMKEKKYNQNQAYDKKQHHESNHSYPYYTHYFHMVHEYIKNTLKYHKEIAPFETNLEGCRWWKIPCNNQTLYRNFMPFYGYLTNVHCYHPYMNYMTGCPALIHKYQHYIFGVATDNHEKPVYYMYGVPGRFILSEQPYEGMTGFVYWHPLQDKKMEKGDYGYWILHIDAKTGNVVMPRKPTPPPCC
ncbi:hypothetical protein QBE52_01565 [Clostridiaceae bacterium 35-E11]